MQIHELPTGTLGDSDYAAIDNGSTNRKLSLKSAINSLITAGISAIQSALTTAQNNITALQNSMSTTNTNIGALQTKVGSASTSNVGDGSLAGAVGNTVMGTTATTLSGAVKEHEDQIGNTDISGIADGTLTGAVAVETGTLSYGTTYFTNANSSLKKVGNIVCVILSGTAASSWSGSHVLATIPSGFRPASTVTGFLYDGTNAGGGNLVNILDSGNIQTPSAFPSVNSGVNIRLVVVYII